MRKAREVGAEGKARDKFVPKYSMIFREFYYNELMKSLFLGQKANQIPLNFNSESDLIVRYIVLITRHSIFYICSY